MSSAKMTMSEAVARAIDRIAERKCAKEFESADLKSEAAAIARESGSKAKDPMASVRQQLQKMRDNGLIKFMGSGKYVVLGGGNLTAQATSATTQKKTKKASGAKKRKRATAKKAKSSTRSSAPKRSRHAISFATYIQRVLKQVAPQIGLSGVAVHTLESVSVDVLKRLGETAFDLVQRAKRKTLSERDLQAAVRLLLHGELAKAAVREGVKAITTYNAGRVEGSRSARAGLVMSVARVERFLRAMMPHTNMSEAAPVYAAAVLEYVLTELLELSANAARDHKRKRIVPRHLLLVIENDSELSHLLNHNAIIARGGVLPDIQAALLPSKKKQKQ